MNKQTTKMTKRKGTKKSKCIYKTPSGTFRLQKKVGGVRIDRSFPRKKDAQDYLNKLSRMISA
jgi:hypothetical protein